MAALDGVAERLGALSTSEDTEALLVAFRDSADVRVGWPAQPPTAPKNSEGWFLRANESVLRELVPRAKLVLELGSYIGKSTRCIADLLAPGAHLITCDAWDNAFLEDALGHNYLRDEGERRTFDLYETFLANLWEARDRVTPMKMLTSECCAAVAKAGLTPDLIYIDADHDYAGVRADVALCTELFPGAVLVGDDWDYAGVRNAAQELRGARPLEVVGFKCWAYRVLDRPRREAVAVPGCDLPRAMGDVRFHPDATRRREPRAQFAFRVLFDALQAWDNDENFRFYLDALRVSPTYASPTHKGRTLLMVAAQFGRVKAIAALVENGADVNARTASKAGETALALAAYAGHAGAVRALLQRGADRRAKTGYGETAEDAARANGMVKCAALLATERTAGASGDALSKVAKSEIAQGQKAPWADAPATLTYAPPSAAEPPPPPRWRGRRAPASEPERRRGAPPVNRWRRGAG